MPPPSGLDEEIQRGRATFLRKMTSESRPTSGRIASAYRGALPGIEADIKKLTASFKGRTPEPEELARLGTLTDFRNGITRELSILEQAVIDETAALQKAGVESGYRAGIEALRRGGMSVTFNQPTLEMIQSTVNYVDSPSWRLAAAQLGDYHGQKAADMVIAAATQGRNPRETAALLRSYFINAKSPLNDALRMARTTQIYGAREGTRQIYDRTGVKQWIWSANLGNARTCLSCITMHGTLHPVSDRLNDHHQGRCAMTPLTPKWEELGFRDGQDLPIQTGIEWFNRQPADVQRAIMGPEFYDAYQRGLFELKSVPRPYMNPIFGVMTRKATLAELIRQ